MKLTNIEGNLEKGRKGWRGYKMKKEEAYK